VGCKVKGQNFSGTRARGSYRGKKKGDSPSRRLGRSGSTRLGDFQRQTRTVFDLVGFGGRCFLFSLGEFPIVCTTEASLGLAGSLRGGDGSRIDVENRLGPPKDVPPAGRGGTLHQEFTGGGNRGSGVSHMRRGTGSVGTGGCPIGGYHHRTQPRKKPGTEA